MYSVKTILLVFVAMRQISLTSTKPVDAIRNPSDFDKIEYAVPKSMIGKILGKGICIYLHTSNYIVCSELVPS